MCEHSCRPVAERIISLVSAQTGIATPGLVGRTRRRPAVRARRLAMWLIRRHTCLTTIEIGSMFGRDHSTVVVGLRDAERLIGQGTLDATLIELALRQLSKEPHAA